MSTTTAADPVPGAGTTRPTTLKRGSFVSDSVAVCTRELLLVFRDPFGLVFSLLQPLIFLGLFTPLLIGSMPGEDPGDILQWYLPGVLVMVALFGTGIVGSNLQYELMTGSYERVLASPLSRPSLIVGRSVKEMLPLVAQAALITVIAIPFGFTLYPAHAVVGLLLLGVFGIGLGALSYSLALKTRSNEWVFWAVQQSLIFPLLILSGMMLPLEDGPQWLQTASDFNPLTYIVEAERQLFNGQVGTDALWGAIAAAVTCAIGLWVGVRTVNRNTV